MKALYIGILSDGTTSRMRADTLRNLLPDAEWDLIDTDSDFRQSTRLPKTMAFRLKSGELVNAVNRKIITQTQNSKYDFAWVDKGVYLWPETTVHIRNRADRMVHFTPDTAFHANRSRHFFSSAKLYDLLVTTKSFEVDSYKQLVAPGKIFLTTQAYDSSLHRPKSEVNTREAVATFIGLCEPDRLRVLDMLLAEGVPICLGGKGWETFARKHKETSHFRFLGQEVFGKHYAEQYARSAIGLGLLSKRFPELHTTRTFEIPACGAVLATERTHDTSEFFAEDEALFFESDEGLAEQISFLLANPEKARVMAANGRARVMNDGRDYQSVLLAVLAQLSLSG